MATPDDSENKLVALCFFSIVPSKRYGPTTSAQGASLAMIRLPKAKALRAAAVTGDAWLPARCGTILEPVCKAAANARRTGGRRVVPIAS